MRRQKTQKQLLFSTNQFRGVWVGSSKTLEPVSETKKWEPHPELRTEGAHIIWSKHQQQRLIYVSESSNAKAVRLGKLSTVLGYCSVVPRTGYAKPDTKSTGYMECLVPTSSWLF